MKCYIKKGYVFMKNNIVAEKSKFFAIRIIRLYKYLRNEKRSTIFQNNLSVQEQVSVQTSEKQ